MSYKLIICYLCVLALVPVITQAQSYKKNPVLGEVIAYRTVDLSVTLKKVNIYDRPKSPIISGIRNYQVVLKRFIREIAVSELGNFAASGCLNLSKKGIIIFHSLMKVMNMVLALRNLWR